MSIVSPYYLPQIKTRVDVIVKKIEEEDVEYEYVKINPTELKPSQSFTLSDNVYDSNIDEMYPIWIDKNLNIIDGHHKFVKALTDNVPLTAIRIDLEFKDACRLLNKIQDIHEYEEQLKMEEVVAQDAINAENEKNSNGSYSIFLNNLEEDNNLIQKEKPSKNDKTIIAYRREPIKENSIIGNFFTLTPTKGYSKYEIDFENLLDTNSMGIQYKDSQVPAEVLAKAWFPNINFEKLSEEYDTPSINLKNKAIAEKAHALGYDGIKYGNTLIQGLK
jgi:hypothetical protein